MKNGTTKAAKIITAVVVLLLFVASIVSSYTYTKAKADFQEKTTTSLKTEGCMPARKAKTTIAVMQKDIEHIKDSVDRIEKAVTK